MTQFNHVEISCEADLLGREERVAAHRARVEREEGGGPAAVRRLMADSRRVQREVRAAELAHRRSERDARQAEVARIRAAQDAAATTASAMSKTLLVVRGGGKGSNVPVRRVEDGRIFRSIRQASLPHVRPGEKRFGAYNRLIRAIVYEEPFDDGFHYDTVIPALKRKRRPNGGARAVQRIRDGVVFESYSDAIRALGIQHNPMQAQRFMRALANGRPFEGEYFRLYIPPGQHGGGDGRRRRDDDGAGDRAEPGRQPEAPGVRRLRAGVPDRDVAVV